MGADPCWIEAHATETERSRISEGKMALDHLRIVSECAACHQATPDPTEESPNLLQCATPKSQGTVITVQRAQNAPVGIHRGQIKSPAGQRSSLLISTPRGAHFIGTLFRQVVKLGPCAIAELGRSSDATYACYKRRQRGVCLPVSHFIAARSEV